MRFSKQTVLVDHENFRIFHGRNVRRATFEFIVEDLDGKVSKFVNVLPTPISKCTFGVARIEGREVPVVRIFNRVWQTLSNGVKYSA